MYVGLALVRFGRFGEVGTTGERPGGDISAGVWDFAHGYAELRNGNPQAAQRHLDRVLSTAASSKAVFKFHSAKTLLGTLGGILEGEIHRSAGDLTDALTAFERAVALDDSTIIDDPEPLPFPARHWLGAALLEVKRFAAAERIYRADLARHPHNGWSLLGLQLALRGQGQPSRAVDEELRASWARSDTPIRASRF
jgi:tetratricopeptide (TPR) repeat protein